MKIFNATRGVVVAVEFEDRNSFIKKTSGLIGAHEPRVVYFETRFGIHTFFMHFSIDVVVLDEAQIVRVMRAELLPGRLFFWEPRFFKVLELPAGSILRTGLQIGDQLIFEP